MSEPLVEVLLSMFNGAPFVREQVDSVLAQTHGNLRLTARDDGSTDDTLQLVGEQADPRLCVRGAENLGLPHAFFRLLDEASDDADFWALCDQDDVWAPDKLARAVATLAPLAGPALYCARVQVTDARLRPLYLHELPRRGPSFANALVQNIALGCTIVLNRRALDLVRGRWPARCVMHDAWLYLVVAGCGTVVYDDRPVVRYRQHGSNSVGVGRSPLSRLRGRVRRQLSADGAGKHGHQDRELSRLFSADLKPESLWVLQEFLAAQTSTTARLRYALTGPAHRQTRGSDLVLKALQTVGRV